MLNPWLLLLLAIAAGVVIINLGGATHA